VRCLDCLHPTRCVPNCKLLHLRSHRTVSRVCLRTCSCASIPNARSEFCPDHNVRHCGLADTGHCTRRQGPPHFQLDHPNHPEHRSAPSCTHVCCCCCCWHGCIPLSLLQSRSNRGRRRSEGEAARIYYSYEPFASQVAQITAAT